MFNLIQHPDQYSILSNLKPIIISADSEVTIELFYNNSNHDSIINLSYYPDFNYMVNVDLTDVIDSLLCSNFPSANNYMQNKFIADFRCQIISRGGRSSFTFSVTKSKIRTTMSFNDFYDKKILTFQPNVKTITKLSPEYLTFAYRKPSRLVVKFYLKNGNTEECLLFMYNGSQVKCFTHDVSFMTVWDRSHAPSANKEPYYDIYVKDDNSVVSDVQRYVYRESFGREKYYLFINTLGGLDTLTCIGEHVSSPSISHNTCRYSRGIESIDNSDDFMSYRQNMGFTRNSDESLVRNFLESKQYHYQFDPETNSFAKIVITESSYEKSDHDNYFTPEFTYRRAESDLMEIRPLNYTQQQLVFTHVANEVDIATRGREITYSDDYSTDKIECTSSSMMIYCETTGILSLLISVDGDSWTVLYSVEVTGNTTRMLENMTVGTYIKLISDAPLTNVKILV